MNAMKRLWMAGMIAILGAGVAAAQNPGAQNEDPADAAEHGVARVSLVNGPVSVTHGDAGEPVGSAMNAPLVTTDRIATGDGARAEVQFDAIHFIRLAPNTEIRMGDLQYHRYLLQLTQGTTTFRVLRDNDAKVEVSTPSVSMIPVRAGTYRVTVRPDGSSEITVRAGEADMLSPGGSERLPAGQTMYSRGSASDPEFMTTGAIPNDDWDRWNADRDRALERYDDASRYASPDIQGAQELSAYGRWVWDAPYGWVWVPGNVGPDWAPYRDGRWDYLNYYGWSWVSYDPWGWAPYHYGRWYRGGFGWAWYPGALGPRHYWRPALVGFFGFGSPGFGTSFGFGYGNVGWVPLAPYEVYRPWYGRGFYGGRGVNIVGNINVYNSYRNARFENAATGLRAGDFGRVGVGRNAFVRPVAGDLSHAGLMNSGVPFTPRGSGFAAGRPGNVVRLTGDGFNRGGWRRPDTQPGNAGGSGGFRGVGAPPQRGQQPVRISPPIVNDRFRAPAANPGAAPNVGPQNNGAPRREFGNFGGPRSDRGPSAPAPQAFPQGGGRIEAPRVGGPPQGGARFEAPRGGGPPSGGGFGGGPRGGGGFGGGPRGGGGGNPGGGGSHGGGGRGNGGGHGGGHGR